MSKNFTGVIEEVIVVVAGAGMSRETTAGSERRSGITTLDLLLFTAGFACGWVMHQGSALRTGQFYICRSRAARFHSLLGTAWIGWLWAFVTGLAFLIVGRRFRYDCRNRPAEWLAVALAIVLFESVYPAFRTNRSRSDDRGNRLDRAGCCIRLRYARNISIRETCVKCPLLTTLWWPQTGESWAEHWWIALRLTAAAAMIAIAGWRLRGRAEPGLGRRPRDCDRGSGHARTDPAGRGNVDRSLFVRAEPALSTAAPARNPGAGRGWPLISTRAPGAVTRSEPWHS